MVDLNVVSTQVLTQNNPTLTVRTAGETIVTGEIVYLDETNLTYKLAQNDGTLEESEAVGIAAHDANAGSPLLVVSQGIIILGATAAPAVGVVYMLSDTAGNIMPVTDHVATQYSTFLGIGFTGNALYMRILATGEQKA